MSTTVLVVDDDGATIALLKEALEQAGYTVVTARDGGEALAQVAAHAPALLVLDLKLPTMGGMEVLQSLRRKRATRLLPVIVLTGRTDFASETEAWLSGAERYLRKPVPMAALVNEVKRLLAPPPSG